MFTEQEKQIFEYSFRGVKRYADPLQVRRRLVQQTTGELDTLMAQASSPTEEMNERGEMVPAQPGVIFQREQARQRLYEICCVAFGIPQFSEETGEGITESEMIGIFNAWVDFLAKKKRTAEN